MRMAPNLKGFGHLGSTQEDKFSYLWRTTLADISWASQQSRIKTLRGDIKRSPIAQNQRGLVG